MSRKEKGQKRGEQNFIIVRRRRTRRRILRGRRRVW